MRAERLSPDVPLSANKHAFKEYMQSFPEGQEAVQIKARKRLAKVHLRASCLL
jgi:hypothetical protein